jgi:hypothetical protein
MRRKGNSVRRAMVLRIGEWIGRFWPLAVVHLVIHSTAAADPKESFGFVRTAATALANSRLRLTYAQSTMLASAIIGAGLFFLFGPWLSDVLIGYGFEIFSPSVTQNMAMFTGAALSFPAGLFFESLPVSRSWLTINGAFWGIASCVIWNGVALLRRRRAENHT